MHTWELVLVVGVDGGGDCECGGEEPLKTKDHPLSAPSSLDVCKQSALDVLSPLTQVVHRRRGTRVR